MPNAQKAPSPRGNQLSSGPKSGCSGPSEIKHKLAKTGNLMLEVTIIRLAQEEFGMVISHCGDIHLDEDHYFGDTAFQKGPYNGGGVTLLRNVLPHSDGSMN